LILIIETSAAFCSVAIVSGSGELLFSNTDLVANSHAEKLPEMVYTALNELGIKASQLSAIGVSKGPGSYTGLRIGTSLAKGLCFACQVPLIALNSFLGMAVWAKSQKKGDVYACHLDARRSEIYEQQFDSQLNILSPVSAVILQPDSYGKMANRKLIICGNSTEKIVQICSLSPFTEVIESTPKAEYLIEETIKKYESNDFENVAYFEPFYLKDFIAGTPKKYTL
jgi:tRNA threonylcarbamoyladenosine biosynthesis protein TsaB